MYIDVPEDSETEKLKEIRNKKWGQDWEGKPDIPYAMEQAYRKHRENLRTRDKPFSIMLVCRYPKCQRGIL